MFESRMKLSGVAMVLALAACRGGAGTGTVLSKAAGIRKTMNRAFVEDCWQTAPVIVKGATRNVSVVPCAVVRAFGTPVQASDLLTLLESRAESNRSGRPGPMSGDVVGVLEFGGDVLARAGVTEAIPVMTELLRDPDPLNRSSMELCLSTLSPARN